MKRILPRSLLITGLVCIGLAAPTAFAQTHHWDASSHDSRPPRDIQRAEVRHHESEDRWHRDHHRRGGERWHREQRYRHPIVVVPVIHHRHCFHPAWRDRWGRYHPAYRSCSW